MKPSTLTYLLVLLSISAFAAPPQEIIANLTDAGRTNSIFVYPRLPGAPSRLVIYSPEKKSVIIDSKSVLPSIANPYSPNSYDGFKLEISKFQENEIKLANNQGEFISIPNINKNKLDRIILTTIEDGNTKSNFNIIYSYNRESNDFELDKVYSVQNNSQCDQSTTGIHKIVNPKIEPHLSKLDGSIAFEYLRKVREQLNTKESFGEKVLSVQTLASYTQAMSAFKERNIEALQSAVQTLIESGGETDTCPPESYIISKYYLPTNVTFNNNLGFLFEQTGHYNEAITLLRKVVSENPSRTVAHLNLGDSYWGAGNPELAKESYSRYISLMKDAGKSGQIPSRASQRGM